MGKLGLRKVKTFMGREGHGFNADLTVDGRVVANVIDSANGGCYSWYWTDGEGKAEAQRLMRKHPAFVRCRTEYPSLGEEEAYDGVISEMIDEVESEKQLRRWCKTKIVFRVDGQPKDQYHVCKGAYSAANVAAIMQRHPGAEIINARFGQPVG